MFASFTSARRSAKLKKGSLRGLKLAWHDSQTQSPKLIMSLLGESQPALYMCIRIMCIRIYIYIHTYIHTYGETERERESKRV